MYILTIFQEDRRTDLAAFNSVEEGRVFAKKIPGYSMREDEGFIYEEIEVDQLPEYTEIEFNGNMLPLSRFMFPAGGIVEIYWIQIANLSRRGWGLVDGASLVDAYMIDNDSLEGYILKREKRYRIMKKEMADRGFELSRALSGSEDGEAIFYRKAGDDWRFLCHMDPFFVEEDNAVEEILNEFDKEQ